MTDDDGNTRFFYNSYLTYIKDANGNRICFVYNGKSFSATGTGWYPSTKGSYLSAIYAVGSGSDKGSKICTLTYDQNHYLASITDYADRTTTFEYSNLTENSAYLTKVNHPDKTTATYGYSSGWLNSAYDDESKYGVEYGYSGTEISSIEEYTGSARGSKILRQKNGVQETKYRYVGDDREATTDDDIVTKYTFDYAGRTINAVTLDNSEREVLGVTAAAYTTNTSRSGKNNRIEKDAQSGQNGINLLVAGGLETHDSFSTAASYWTRVTYPDDGSYSKKNAVVKTGESARHGTGALKSYLNNAATGACGDGQIKPIFILVFSAAAIIGEEVHGTIPIAVDQIGGVADGGFSDTFLRGELPAKARAHIDIICCRNAQQPAVRNISTVEIAVIYMAQREGHRGAGERKVFFYNGQRRGIVADISTACPENILFFIGVVAFNTGGIAVANNDNCGVRIVKPGSICCAAGLIGCYCKVAAGASVGIPVLCGTSYVPAAIASDFVAMGNDIIHGIIISRLAIPGQVCKPTGA